jgi:cation-transporting P-type ATPase E
VPGFFLALAPGAPLARPGFTRRVLAFTIPAGTAAAVAGLAAYAIALSTPGVSTAAARTAATLAVFTVGLWVLAIIVGLPALMRIALVAAMAGALVLLFAVPLARQVFALQLPPASVCAWGACVSAAAIAGLTLWTQWRSGHATAASVLSPSER